MNKTKYQLSQGMIKDKRTIYIENFDNKTITVLVSKKSKNVICKDGETHIYKFGSSNRLFCYINNCKGELDLKFIPTNLKKTRIYAEPLGSCKLRNILTKKFKRVNN